MNGPQCPECSHSDTRRVPATGLFEGGLSYLFFHTYRCQRCCARFRHFRPSDGFATVCDERRELDRSAVSIDATVANPERGRISIRVSDLSPEGCRCRSDATLHIGEVFDLSLYLVRNESPVHILGAVVRENENDVYGLVFKQIGNNEWHLIRRYLSLVRRRKALRRSPGRPPIPDDSGPVPENRL